MGPILIQNTAGVVTVYLTLQDGGGPAGGLTFSALTVGLRKTGEATYTNMSLDGTSFVEIGTGVYDIHLATGDTSVVGNFTLRIGGAVVNPQIVYGFVTDALPVDPAIIVVPPQRTGIFGFLKDSQGNPVKDSPVFVRILGTPFHDSTIAYTTDSVVVETDDQGYFFLTLVTGIMVTVTIPAVNYTRSLTVPVSNVNLFGIV